MNGRGRTKVSHVSGMLQKLLQDRIYRFALALSYGTRFEFGREFRRDRKTFREKRRGEGGNEGVLRSTEI